MISRDYIAFLILALVSLRKFMEKKQLIKMTHFLQRNAKLSGLKPDANRELRNHLRQQEFALHLRNAMSSAKFLQNACVRA